MVAASSRWGRAGVLAGAITLFGTPLLMAAQVTVGDQTRTGQVAQYEGFVCLASEDGKSLQVWREKEVSIEAAPEEAAPPVVFLLPVKEKTPEVRYCADPKARAQALASIGRKSPAWAAGQVRSWGQEGMQEVRSLLSEKTTSSRATRIGAISVVKSMKVVDAVDDLSQAALKDSQAEVRQAAAQAVAEISGETPDLVVKALASKETRSARNAAEAIAVIGDRKGVEHLVEITHAILEIKLVQMRVSNMRDVNVQSAIQLNANAPPINIELPETEVVSIGTSVIVPARFRAIEKVLTDRITRRGFDSPQALTDWWDAHRKDFR